MGDDYIERMESMETLNRRGSFLKETFFPTQLKPRFPKNKLLIGFNVQKKTEIWLPATESFRLLLCGSTRSGKTYLSERILSTAFRGGNAVAILSDVKNEFWSLDKPLQKKFHKDLAKEEAPMAMPIRVYRPQFLIQNDKGKDYGNVPAQISIHDCEIADLVTLLGIEKDESKRGLVAYIMNGVKKGEIELTKDIPDYVNNLPDFTSSQKKSILIKFAPLFQNGVIGDDYPFNFAEDIAEGKIPILNMEGFEAFGREFSSFPQAYLAIGLRQLIRAKRNGDIDKKLYIFIDELPRFCSRLGESTSKIEIKEAVDLVAGKGINFVFATQDTDSLPPEILRQSRFVMLPYNAGRNLIENVMKEKGIMRWSPTAMNSILDAFKEMKKFQWVIIDSSKAKEVVEEDPFGNLEVFKSYAPLGHHLETIGRD